MNCSFTHDHYIEILSLLQDEGYNTVSFSSFKPGKPYQLILRHDIDFLGKNLYKLLELEAEIGFRSVNHFLLTSEIYNVNSLAVKNLLIKLKKFGHYVGLHVDPHAFTSRSSLDLKEEFKNLLNLAKSLLGSIDSYSFHRPTIYGIVEELYPKNLTFKVPRCTYEDIFVKNIIYRSDSRREWQNLCICREIESFNGQSLQLLIHANWWDAKEINRETNIKNFINIIKKLTNTYLTNNLSFLSKSSIPISDFFITNEF